MSAASTRRVHVIDSHTEGEPTRVIVEGGPMLGGGALAERRGRLAERFVEVGYALVNEPRGSGIEVGAILGEPVDPACAAGVVFFNNVGVLGMCGHGAIGVVATLAYLGRIGPGEHRLETPVGVVETRLHGDGRITIRNVPSFRHAAGVVIDVPGHGPLRGDVAWGGNWFFLTGDHGQELSFCNVARLTDFTWRIRRALEAGGVTGADGGRIDHIELFGPPVSPDADGRSFVLCPGGAYDRSPCGTGTSAKLACLAADGQLAPGQVWRQESIIGSTFEASYEAGAERIIPSITGRAFVTAETTLVFDERDPFCLGIRA